MHALWRRPLAAALLLFHIFALGLSVYAQTGNTTAITGVVEDPTGAVIPGATIQIQNAAAGFTRSVPTDASGKFTLNAVPFNSYHLTASAPGFADYAQDVQARSAVVLNLTIQMQLAEASQSVTVEAGPETAAQTSPTFATDVNRSLIEKLPTESASSPVSSLVTLTAPGVAADSNGMMHGLGDHADNQFVVDGQPMRDQQSKAFSNQIPEDSIESMLVIAGAPPAEYGGKTSLVIDVKTRSGQGMTQPHGSVSAGYGSFGTSTAGFDLGYGGTRWGNFLSVNGMNSGRFLDTPEFTILHDHGNQENVFDRFDYQPSPADTLHANLQFTRSWFQNPNSFDQQTHIVNGIQLTNRLTGAPLGLTDQRSQIRTYNIAPTWTHLHGESTLFTFGAWVRRDVSDYYPSNDPLNDYSPDLQSESVGQERTLTNAGLRGSVSYVKGMHNVKAGVSYEQTLLDEHDRFGIVDPTVGADSPFDLTSGGPFYHFNGHTDVKEFAVYVQDAITKGNWNFNLGIRGDVYNGLTGAAQAEPRVGAAYNIARTKTVLRLSYARVLDTPYNENLVLSSLGCQDVVLNPLLSCSSFALSPLTPGRRNEFHAGLEQSFGRHLSFSGEYIWKYTRGAYDFSIFGNTPIAFPVEWTKSKIPGFVGRLTLTNYHGVSAFTSFSSVSARFFEPQVGGAGAAPSAPGGVFRIDHDERFNQTTHVQYQPWKRGPWIGFNWRYDSGLVAGAVPFSANGEAVDTSMLTADQQFQAGLFCGSVRATPTTPIPNPCPASQYGSTLLKIPRAGTENNDKNPPRVRPRHLFDLAIGDDDLFHGEKYKWSAQFTVVNLANEYSLYNFLSTFSGTHYVSPRSYMAQLGFHF